MRGTVNAAAAAQRPSFGSRCSPSCRRLAVVIDPRRPRFYADDPHRPRAGDAGRLGGAPARHRAVLPTLPTTCSSRRPPAVGHRARRTSTPSTKCRTRAGSPIASAPQPLSLEDLARGPNAGKPPGAGALDASSARRRPASHPGFTARDANGETWFLKFDPPGFPGGRDRRVVVATKFFWALGYNQVETFITTLRSERGRRSTRRRRSSGRPASGRRSPATISTRSSIGPRATPDGTYRVVGGSAPDGESPRAVPLLRARAPTIRTIRAARAPPRAARAPRLRRLDQPDRHEGGQHAGHARHRERPRVVKHYLQDVGSTFGMAQRPA